VLAGKGDGTLTVISWDDEDDLHEKLVALLARTPTWASRSATLAP
jgi:hypothetical protein